MAANLTDLVKLHKIAAAELLLSPTPTCLMAFNNKYFNIHICVFWRAQLTRIAWEKKMVNQQSRRMDIMNIRIEYGPYDTVLTLLVYSIWFQQS